MDSYSDSYITINRSNLIHNANYFKSVSNKKLIGVIKSNAYGHGLFEVANTLNRHCDAFAVASLDEAIYLRDMHIDIPILVLNEINPKFINFVINYNLMITVSNLNFLYQINALIPDNQKLLIQLKIDSGMNRMGIKDIEEYKRIVEYIKENPKLLAIGLFTHFHTPKNKELSKKQIEFFQDVIDLGINNYQYIHMASSNAVLNQLDINESTHIRIGLGLYGLCDDFNLKPALSLYSKINTVKKVYQGEIVGYNANFKALEDCLISVLPIGYNDGILRANVGRNVYVDNNLCEIIGSVCMNSLIIKIPNGDIKKEVELIGPHVSVLEIAKHLNTIPYEVVTCLAKDLKRVII